ncbi:cell cycle control protein 50A-like isoform X2 [Limulus polyphemus]|uniref:Cell cycle control protein 50A-like isoform X2 n=1 Tax=Limulus polyphemus TaxID=6850 RepID=A0ABM1T3F0_LIMPO|nr:cell cycle control protein 50A-like isoform X2 [Limulus polyphemus]
MIHESGSAFKQQKLQAWQPILTAGTVLPSFFIIGLAFIPIGIGLLVSSNKVQEFQLDYTYCLNEKGEECAEVIKKNFRNKCICKIEFNLTEDFERNVFVYYGLTNYYQNHRRYVKSRDDQQLLGKVTDTLSADCKPFAYVENSTYKTPIAPCGAIANSLFNDTITLKLQGNKEVEVPLLNTGIAWPTDTTVKFQNPPGDVSTGEAFTKTAKPLNWDRPVWQLDPSHSENNGYQNEDLIVWMRNAALPTFRKLYRRVDHEKEGFKNHLPKGIYNLIVQYTYPVTSFKGTKRLILSNTTWLGGKNPFLGITYIVVGSICLILSIMFLVIHKKFGKSPHDVMGNITERTPY